MFSKKYIIPLLFVLFLASLSSATELTFEPLEAEDTVGDTIKLFARIDNVEYLRSYRIRIDFDPEKLQVEEFEPHDFLNGGFSIWGSGTGFNNNIGRINIQAVIMGIGDVSGSGKIATIIFRNMCMGQTEISYDDSNCLLLDKYLDPIYFTSYPAILQLNEGEGPVLDSIPDISFNEDENDTLFLDQYVEDSTDPDSVLFWGSQSDEHILVEFTEDRKAIISAEENWFGEGEIIFTVTDPMEYCDKDTVSVIVTSVNDPPEIMDIPNITFDEDSTSSPILLNTFISDVEDPDSLISWNYSLNNENIVAEIDNNNIAIIYGDSDYFGEGVIIFTATDTDSSTVQDTSSIEIVSINDPPIITPPLPDISFLEDESNDTLLLNEYITDVDSSPEEIDWTVLGESFVDVVIDSIHFAHFTASENWFGEEELTFMATDLDDASDSDSILVTVLPVNDPPVIGTFIPISFPEDTADTSLQLNDFVTDPDNSDEELEWSYSNNSMISVTISETHQVTFTPENNWHGTEIIYFTVHDSPGLWDTDSIEVTVTPVNDPPEMSDLPNINFSEDGMYDSLYLDNYVSDVDDSLNTLDWSYSGNSHVYISIDEITHQVTFTAQENWFGSENIIFTVSDPSGDSDSDTIYVEVTPVNDPPDISYLPDIEFPEDHSDSTLDLDDYVSDPDDNDAQLQWSYSGNSIIDVTISETHQVIFTPEDNWFGTELIHFTVQDTSGLTDMDSTTVTVTSVNDEPEITGLPDISFSEDGVNDSLDLDNHVMDADDSLSTLDWSYSGNSHIYISIDEITHQVTFTAQENWFGSENIIFTVSDPFGDSDSDTIYVEVTPVNDPPDISYLPDIEFFEDHSDSTLHLDEFVSDPDDNDAQLQWSYSGNSMIDVTISETHQVTFTPQDNWFGSEVIHFTVQDTSGLSDMDSTTVTVTSVNDPPEITGLPDISFPEDGVNDSLDLDDHVSDVDDSLNILDWTYSGNSHIYVSIDEITHQVTFTAQQHWFGSENIVFTVSDPFGDSDSDTISVHVTSVNDPPIVGDIPNIGFISAESDSSLFLTDYVSDVDNDNSELNWSYTGNDSIQIDIQEDTQVIFSCEYGYEGSESITFTATDPGGLWDSDSTIVTVTYLGSPPVVDSLPPVSFNEDKSDSFDLDDYVYDSDHDPEELSWSANCNDENILIQINNSTHITNISATENYYVEEVVVIFTVTDPDALSDSASTTVTIFPQNDAPQITQIDSLSAIEDQEFTYQCSAVDVDEDTLTFYDDTDLFNITSEGLIEFTPEQIDVGEYDVTIGVTDGELNDETNFPLTVIEVNEPPVLDSLGDWEISEDTLFTYLVTATDEEDDSLTFYDNTELFDIDPLSGEISFIPTQENVGSHLVVIGVSDGELFDESEIQITIMNTPDPPELDSIPDMSTYEDDLFEYTVSAADEDSDALTYYDDTDLFTIGENTGDISFIPLQENVGSHQISITVQDSTGLTDSTQFILTILNTNDAPVLDSIGNWTISEDSVFTFDVDAFDEDGDSLTFYDDTDLFDIDPNTGLITFVPIQEDVGYHSVVIGVSDSLLSDEEEIFIEILNTPDAPIIDSIPDMTTLEDTLFVYYVTANDEDGDNFSFSDNTDLFNINPNTGKISFTPEQEDVGIHAITITVTDTTGLTDNEVFELTIENVNDPPILEQLYTWTAYEDSLFQYQVEANDEDGDSLTFYDDTDIFDIHPDSGLVSFIPLQEDVGNHEIIISVSDGEYDDEDDVFLEILNVPDSPIIDSIPDMSAMEDSIFQYQVIANDEDEDQLTFSDDTDLFDINPNTGMISFIPIQDEIGNYEIGITVTDPTGLTDSDTFMLSILNTPDIPDISPIPNQTTYEDSLFVYQVQASDEDGDSLTFYDDTDIFDINPETGLISFVPIQEDVGEYDITIWASDGIYSDSTDFAMEIINVNDAPEIEPIDDMEILEDTLFTYDVQAFDEDDDDLEFYDNTTLFDIDHDTGEISFTPLQEDVGDHEISIWVTDGFLSDTTTFYMEIINVNDPPMVTGLPDIEFNEDESDSSLDLDNYVIDEDHTPAEINWDYTIYETTDRYTPPQQSRTGNLNAPFLSKLINYSPSRQISKQLNPKQLDDGELFVDIDSLTHVVTFSGSDNWFGNRLVAFIAIDPENGSGADTTYVNVISVNDPPIVEGIPDVAFESGDSACIDLDEYVSDIDHEDWQIEWDSESSSDFITVEIDTSRTAIIRSWADWTGDGWIVFTAIDPESGVDTDTIQVEVNASTVDDSENTIDVPEQLRLRQNYPNPFNPITVIRFELPKKQFVDLRIYDITGRLVKILVNDTCNTGYYSIKWDGTTQFGEQASSGMYLYRLRTSNHVETKKMILLR